MSKTLIALTLLSLIATTPSGGAAETKKSIAELIAESQANAATDKVFTITPSLISDVDVKAFSDPAEFSLRRGAPNFIGKCAAGEQVTLAFIGGSITQGGNRYREQAANYIASIYPDVEMKGVAAGVGGTGAGLGASRISRDILAYDPDIVFIEFAVNGSNECGVEGMIRKIIKHNPHTDICLIYTIYGGQSEIYARGEVPPNIARLDRVAQYYNLPSIHMGLQAGVLEKQERLLWKAPKNYSGDKLVFTNDGVHPITMGGNLYASAIARCFEAMTGMGGTEQLSLPDEPLHADNLDRAALIDPSLLGASKCGWKVVKGSNEPSVTKYFESYFKNISIADKKSKPLKFSFRGNLLGIYDIGGPDATAINIYIDGKKYIASQWNHNGKVIGYEAVDRDDPRPSLVRFKESSIERYSPLYETIKLDEGDHNVEICVTPNGLDKSTVVDKSRLTAQNRGDIFRLGWVIINGEILERK